MQTALRLALVPNIIEKWNHFLSHYHLSLFELSHSLKRATEIWSNCVHVLKIIFDFFYTCSMSEFAIFVILFYTNEWINTMIQICLNPSLLLNKFILRIIGNCPLCKYFSLGFTDSPAKYILQATRWYSVVFIYLFILFASSWYFQFQMDGTNKEVSQDVENAREVCNVDNQRKQHTEHSKNSFPKNEDSLFKHNLICFWIIGLSNGIGISVLSGATFDIIRRLDGNSVWIRYMVTPP